MLAWHLRFELPATSLALALLEDEMVDLLSMGGSAIT